MIGKAFEHLRSPLAAGCIIGLLFTEPMAFGAQPHWGVSGAFGYLQSITDADNETSKEGLVGGLKGLVGWERDSHRYDIGLGLGLNTGRGENEERRQAITQTDALLDFTYYYALASFLDLGLTWQNEFGRGAHLNFDDVDKPQWWSGIGPTVKFGLPLDGWSIEIGASALMDFTVPERTQVKIPVFVTMLFGKAQPAQEAKVEPKQTPKPEPIKAPPPVVTPPTPVLAGGDIAAGYVAQVMGESDVKITLPTSRVFFVTGSATVDAKGVDYLGRLGRALGAQADAIIFIDVSGHTDRRGSAALNDRLSKSRAEGVLGALIQGGAPKAKMQARGAGSSEPRDTGDSENAHAANRRVELSIKVGRDAKALAEVINKLDLEYKR